MCMKRRLALPKRRQGRIPRAIAYMREFRMKHWFRLIAVAFAIACYAEAVAAKTQEFQLDDHAAVATEVMQPGEIDHNVMPGMTDTASDEDPATPPPPVAVPAPVSHPVPAEIKTEEPIKVEKKPVAEKPVKLEKPVEKPIREPKKNPPKDVKPAKPVAKAEPVAEEIPTIETDNEVSKSDDVNYVTGGIGEDEKQAIEAAKGDYNLHVMSASLNGAFVGDARVIIRQKDGKVLHDMLNVVAGPLLYVKLPPGSYVLEASLGAQTKRQNFSVSKKGAPARIHLGWKVDATLSN